MESRSDRAIQVKVRVYAGLRRFLPELSLGESATWSLPPGTALGDLIDRIGMPRQEIKTRFVNGRQQEADYLLQDADEVAFFPPIGGGSETGGPGIEASAGRAR